MAMVSFDLLCLHNGRKYYFTFNLGRERERASDRSNGDSDDEIIREQNQINWFDFNIKLRICRAGHAFISIECTKQKNHQGIHKMKMVTEPNKTETEKRKIITNNIENESVHRFFLHHSALVLHCIAYGDGFVSQMKGSWNENRYCRSENETWTTESRVKQKQSENTRNDTGETQKRNKYREWMKLKNRLRKHNTHIYTNTPDTHKYTDIYRQNREMLTSKNVTNHPTKQSQQQLYSLSTI